MASVERIKPNGSQALLSHDDAMDNIVAYRWDGFIRQFEGLNLFVAQSFTQTFDGTRAKIGDFHIEVTEGLITEATGLSQEAD